MDHTNIVVDRSKCVKSPPANDRRRWMKEGRQSQQFSLGGRTAERPGEAALKEA